MYSDASSHMSCLQAAVSKQVMVYLKAVAAGLKGISSTPQRLAVAAAEPVCSTDSTLSAAPKVTDLPLLMAAEIAVLIGPQQSLRDSTRRAALHGVSNIAPCVVLLLDNILC